MGLMSLGPSMPPSPPPQNIGWVRPPYRPPTVASSHFFLLTLSVGANLCRVQHTGDFAGADAPSVAQTAHSAHARIMLFIT